MTLQTSTLQSQEDVFSSISVIHDNAMSPHSEHIQKILNRLTSTFLKPTSSILDVGSGTGKPIAAHFASNGHHITGIDYSLGMIESAQSQVPNATFIHAVMTSWEPSKPKSYDLVIASNSFYNLSVAQIRTMIYKFTEWVKDDGIIVIGSSFNEPEMKEDGAYFDHRGWAEGFPQTFLGHKFEHVTLGREEAWVNLIKETGLEVVDVDRALCLKQKSTAPDMQFYFIARRVQDNHLIGPFPIPKSFNGPVTVRIDVWNMLKERLEGKKVEQATFEALRKRPSCRKLLYVSKFRDTLKVPNVSGLDIQQSSELPSPGIKPGSFDGVLLDWILHIVPSPGQYIDDAIAAITPTGHARFIVVQAAPDNELVNLCNTASESLDLPIQHHGYLLKEAETRLKAAGFQTITYIRSQGTLNFGSAQDGRIETAARALSGVFGDKATGSHFEERLKKLLKIHFSFKPSGEITCHTVILVAERN